MLRKKFVISEILINPKPTYLHRDGRFPLFHIFTYQGSNYCFSNNISHCCRWIDYNEAEAFLIAFSDGADKIYPQACYTIVTIYERES